LSSAFFALLVLPYTEISHRHLTEVEERLEKAETLLRTFFTDAELSQMLAHGIASGSDTQGVLSSGNTASALGSGLKSPRNVLPGTQNRSPSTSSNTALPEQSFDLAYLESPNESGVSVKHEDRPLENQPAADDDFEWDEREPEGLMAASGNDAVNALRGGESDVRKLTDGMATLTADDSNAGFLGSVSGSALLKLIWMGSGAEAATSTPLERRRTLEQLYKDGSSEHPSTAPWYKAQPLLTRALVDTLIDAYFALYHPTFPILHEPTFREQYGKLSGRISRSTWHTLANLVAALGSFVSSTCSDDTHATLFNAVKANLSVDSLETGSVTLVQTFAMAANYLQKRNRPNSGYNYGGIALRLAISLGLHKEFRGWQTAPFKKEIRRRVWWSLCVLDVGATVTYGRPLNWPQVGVDIPFPLNIHEKVGVVSK
jgi:transcriptional regulatory protein GAL4